jgi:hypothetical protein
MKGDFSRLTFDPRKRYSGVLMQQGRVQTDADWNEQLDIQRHRAETEALDTIGPSGVPKGTGGFEIQPLASAAAGIVDLAVSPGRIYVDGLLCESDAGAIALSAVQAQQATAAGLDADGRPLAAGQWVEISGDDALKATRLITDVDADSGVLTFDADLPPYQDSDHPFLRRVTTYLTQPDQSEPEFSTTPAPDAPVQLPTLTLPKGYYLAYLHVSERHVTALDDPLIREVALGGPDTTTRVKNVWRVGLLPVTAPVSDPLDCGTQFPEWDALTASPTGLMNARTEVADDPKDPCLLPPEAGYRRLENQLYRIEIQKGGARDAATFKWSRENGSIQTSVEKVQGSVVTVADLGRDEVLGFKGGDWVEIVDDESEADAAPRPLALVTKIEPTLREVTLDVDVSALAGRAGLRLRRWEQSGTAATADGVAMTGDWLDLEGGIQVQFSEGAYRSGDYWLIPARSATAEIEWPPFDVPNESPAPQPPRGARHRFCRLALLFSDAGISVVEDCRALFPPLSHICAEDVCFDNTQCQLPNVETVQDAIEQLCREHDLRFHNKNLHGWGIVNGLQVQCGPDEAGAPCRHVTVLRGYALDCEGNDINHTGDDVFDLIRMIDEYNAQQPDKPVLDGDGEVCLVLNSDPETPYSLEKYDPSSDDAQSIFKNTLWSDFLEGCLGDLVTFLKKELSGGQSKQLVSPAQKLQTTLFNLLIQLFNKTNGQYVYLSGEKGLEDGRTEHTILHNLYTGLRELLKSHTFCAMFDDTDFPPYPYGGLNAPTTKPPYSPTIFGKGYHRRLRVSPTGKLACTMGMGNKINVYDLVANEMVAELEFPDAAAVVQDVAFSQKGAQLYAVATLNGKDSLFAVANIQPKGYHWHTPMVVCDVLLVSLATRANSSKVYAAGRGKGIYELNPSNIPPNLAPAFDFNATGRLVVVVQGSEAYAYATARGQGVSNVYDQVLRYDLNKKQTTQTFHLAINGQDVNGSDDIAVSDGAKQPQLYVVTNPPSNSSNKHLLIFDARGETAGPVTAIDLEEMTPISLAFNHTTNNLMLTYADSYRVRLVGTNNKLVAGFRHPVQIAPTSIVYARDSDAQGHRVYVLNSVSNTISSVPAERFAPSKQLKLQDLVEYRAKVLEAFVRLFGGLLQYLKDCLCDLLLVKPPTCAGDEKLYLACVQIKNGSIYKICNFSKRKYVKSFPTVEYWLSALPVIPLVGKAVEAFCCAVLPELFSGYKASTSQEAQNKLASNGMYVVLSVLYSTSFKKMLGRNFGGLPDAAARLLRDIIACAAQDLEQAPSFERESIVGAQAEDAFPILRENGINVVGADTYDPCNALYYFAQFFNTPGRLAQGSRIRLTLDDGIIRGYTPVSASTDRDTSWPLPSSGAGAGTDAGTDAAAGGARAAEEGAAAGFNEASGLREELSRLREEFEQARQEHAAALTSRDATIAGLETSTRALQDNLKVLDELQRQVKALSARPARRASKKEEPPPQTS